VEALPGNLPSRRASSSATARKTKPSVVQRTPSTIALMPTSILCRRVPKAGRAIEDTLRFSVRFAEVNWASAELLKDAPTSLRQALPPRGPSAVDEPEAFVARDTEEVWHIATSQASAARVTSSAKDLPQVASDRHQLMLCIPMNNCQALQRPQVIGNAAPMREARGAPTSEALANP
jgi:hypothetical protein